MASDVVMKSESTYTDRDAGEVLVQMNTLEEVFDSLANSIRAAERRLEHVLNPCSSPLGMEKLAEIHETKSPLAERMYDLVNRMRGIRQEVDAWTERIEL